MSFPSNLTDEELRAELKELGFEAGPVTASTRSVFEKKLVKLRSSNQSGNVSSISNQSPQRKGRSPGRPRKSVPNESTRQSTDFPSSVLNITPTHEKVPSPRRQSSRTSSASSRRSSVRSGAAIPSPVVIAAAEQSDNELDLSLASSLPKVSTFKRTPTPPRPTLSAQRAFIGRYSTTRSNVTDRPIISRRLYSETDNDEDQSTESSRILPSHERRSYGASYASSGRSKGDSPVEMIKRFGSSATKFLQNKVNNLPYVRHESERGKYGTPNGRLSPVFRPRADSSAQKSDLSKLLVMIFGSFTIVLALAYVLTAHSRTVARTNRLIISSVYDTMTFLYNYAIFPVFITALFLGGLFVAFFVYKKRKIARETFERRTMELVDKIADRVRDAGDIGVAEQHLRDTLLPPTRRTPQQMEVWQSAVEFINNMDSRMRSETRLIKGVECNVWVWVNAHDLSENGKSGWMESSDYSSPKAHTPIRALSRCLKIRDLAEDHPKYDGELKREIYAKLRPIVPLHFSINRAPNGTHVYMMFRDLEDAKTAFDIFHTQWFKYKGTIAAVKYVMDARYNERFPETVGL